MPTALPLKSDLNVISAFSTRHQGNMSLVYGDTKDSLANRNYFLSNLDIGYRDLVCAKQVHGSCVRYAKEEDRGKGALSYDSSVTDTDALITDRKNLPLVIFTADCLSIFLYDPTTSAVGLVHAGWRSTRENIVTKTVQLMQQQFNSQTSNLYVGFGPAIRGCCYEVDLLGINKKQLLDLGVRETNIFDSNICTFCQNEDFFSYRKEGTACGRMIAVIMLKD